MSLVGSADMSTRSYGNPKFFSLPRNNSSSGLSAQLYGTDKHKLMYMTESFIGPTYDPKYMDSPPSEELIDLSSTTRNPFESSSFIGIRHSEPPYSSSYEFESLVGESPDVREYDEDMIRVKLQELEHVLLDDDNNTEDEVVIGPENSMELDEIWAGSLRNMILHESPKESTSSDSSNLSSVSCSKEVTLSPRTPKQLLFDCATMISKGNRSEAEIMITELRQMASIQGDPSQRIAAYVVEGLAARLGSSGSILYKALKCKEPPSLDKLAAMQILFEVCPCYKFGFLAANSAIMETIKNENKVHIIDFDINQGNQYINLMQSLAKQGGKKTQLRLTGVDDPESVQRPVGGLNNIGQRLKALAEIVGMPFEFKAISASNPLVSPSNLDIQPGEALVVNFTFQLHHIPDESVSTINQRDQLLRMVKSLNPTLVTIVEQDVNTNTAPFLPRFAEAYSYYSAVFESLEATLPRDSQDRMNVEKQCLAREIVNIIACEGEERVERYEVAGKWRARMLMAGFSPWALSKNVSDTIQQLIGNQYCDRYKLKEDMGMLRFGWEDKNLIVASAWT